MNGKVTEEHLNLLAGLEHKELHQLRNATDFAALKIILVIPYPTLLVHGDQRNIN